MENRAQFSQLTLLPPPGLRLSSVLRGGRGQALPSWPAAPPALATGNLTPQLSHRVQGPGRQGLCAQAESLTISIWTLATCWHRAQPQTTAHQPHEEGPAMLPLLQNRKFRLREATHLPKHTQLRKGRAWIQTQVRLILRPVLSTTHPMAIVGPKKGFPEDGLLQNPTILFSPWPGPLSGAGDTNGTWTQPPIGQAPRLRLCPPRPAQRSGRITHGHELHGLELQAGRPHPPRSHRLESGNATKQWARRNKTTAKTRQSCQAAKGQTTPSPESTDVKPFPSGRNPTAPSAFGTPSRSPGQRVSRKMPSVLQSPHLFLPLKSGGSPHARGALREV